MRMRLLAVLAAASAVSACGGSIPYDSLTAETIKAFCHKYAACGAVSSEAACNTRFADDLAAAGPNPYESRIQSGKVVYDGARAKACLDGFAKTSCDTGFSYQSQDCELTYQGTVKLGEVCTASVECAPGGYCAMSSSGTCSGVCAKRTALNETLPTGGECEYGLVPIDNKCVAPLSAGAACNSFLDCDPAQNLYCGTAKVCQKARLEGETCDADQRCGGLLTCSSGHCSRYLPVATSCAAVSGVAPQCQIDLFCDSNSKLCATPGGEGASCTSSSGCVDPFRCAGTLGAMKCTKPATENQSCLMVPCDSKLYCESLTNICKTRIATGQACTQSNSCVSESYCTGGTCTVLFCQ